MRFVHIVEKAIPVGLRLNVNYANRRQNSWKCGMLLAILRGTEKDSSAQQWRFSIDSTTAGRCAMTLRMWSLDSYLFPPPPRPSTTSSVVIKRVSDMYSLSSRTMPRAALNRCELDSSQRNGCIGLQLRRQTRSTQSNWTAVTDWRFWPGTATRRRRRLKLWAHLRLRDKSDWTCDGRAFRGEPGGRPRPFF